MPAGRQDVKRTLPAHTTLLVRLRVSMSVLTTLFLDAGGVIVHPSWTRVSAALERQGVAIGAPALAAAEPRAKKEIDAATVVGATDDRGRGWLYFNKVLAHAGVELSDATDRALEELRTYHGAENLWEHVPDDVVPALDALRATGLRLVVVSNANGRLRHLFDRLDLTQWFDAVLDSHEWGVEKPDPRLFRIALQKSGADPSTTAHVGDLYHVDVVGARAAGIRHGVLLDAAGLYPDADCPRVASLSELVTRLQRGEIT
jgi:HAD superfamily hydrolase (TIGR01549 family)